jgi:hypothetical protein
MNYQSKTVVQLKEICKKKNISGYSKLNKKELISFIKKNLKKGGEDDDLIVNPTKNLGFNYTNVNCIYNNQKQNLKLNFDYNLHDKYLDFIFSQSTFPNNKFSESDLKKMTNFERYLLYLCEYNSIIKNLKTFYEKKIIKKSEIFGIVIYQKSIYDRKKNLTNFGRSKYKSSNDNKSYYFMNHIKILKIKKCRGFNSYLNMLIKYFNKYTQSTYISSHCLSTKSKLRLKIEKPPKPNNWDVFSKIPFKNETLCIPINNPYIEKCEFNFKKNIKNKENNFSYENIIGKIVYKNNSHNNSQNNDWKIY